MPVRDLACNLSDLPKDRPPVVLMAHLNLVRPLGMAGIPVILTTSDPDDIALRSRYVTGHCFLPGFKAGADKVSLDILMRVGATLEAHCGRKIPLFYGGDESLAFLHQHKDTLSAHYLFVVNHDGLAEAFGDKERFYALCAERGVLAPKSIRASELSADTAASLRFPVIVKPRAKVDWYAIQRELFDGSAKARVFETPMELLENDAVRRHADSLVICEYIDGGDDRIFSFHGFCDEDGRVLACFAGKKIRTFPRLTGESSYLELVKEPALEALGRDIVAKLGVRGVFKIDFKQEPVTQRFFVLEINARFNLWHYLGAKSGVNLPAIAYHWLVDRKAPETALAYTTHHRWVDFYMDYQAFRELYRRREITLTAWLQSLLSPNTIYSDFAWKDPRPWATWLSRYVGDKMGQHR